MKLSITPVQAADYPAVVHLLEKARLPTVDLPENLAHFFKAETGCRLAGTAGLEMHGKYALLRSLAVAGAFRNLKIGQALYAQVVQHAKNQHVAEIFLVTTTAEGYFGRRGFVRVEREAVPVEIRQTQQFQGLCPGSAAVMRLVLQTP